MAAVVLFALIFASAATSSSNTAAATQPHATSSGGGGASRFLFQAGAAKADLRVVPPGGDFVPAGGAVTSCAVGVHECSASKFIKLVRRCLTGVRGGFEQPHEAAGASHGRYPEDTPAPTLAEYLDTNTRTEAGIGAASTVYCGVVYRWRRVAAAS